MIDEMAGKVAYAVPGYGGILGRGCRGDDHYPAPWARVKYDTGLGSYVTNVTKEQLDKAPRYESGDEAMELRQRRAGPLPSFAALVKQGSSRGTGPEPGF
jgi:hypothetical protein